MQTSKQGHTRDCCQSSMTLNEALNLFGKLCIDTEVDFVIVHMYKWGLSSTGIVRKHGYTHITCSIMVEKLCPRGGDFSIIIRA